MDIRQLRYFAAVAELGNLTRAARTLNLAQPALSQSVAQLEKELGVRLLHRSSRGVTPTEAGAALLESSRGIIADVERVKRDIQALADPARAAVVVGLPLSLAPLILPPLTRWAAAQQPPLRVRVVEAVNADLADMLSEGVLDLALILDAEQNRNFALFPLFWEHLYLASRPAPRAKGAETIRFAALQGHDLAMPTRPPAFVVSMLNHARLMKIRLNVTVEAVGIPTTLALVRGGQAMAVLPLTLMLAEVREGHVRARRIVEPDMARLCSLALSTRRPGSARRDAVADRLRTLALEILSNLRGPLKGGIRPASR